MTSRISLRKLISGGLIVAGLVVILGVGAGLVSQQVRGQQLRAQLQQTPIATPLPPPTATPPPTEAAPIPTATATASPTPTASPTAANPSPAPTASPTATTRPSLTPVVIPTVLPKTATATAPLLALASDLPVRIVMELPIQKIDTKVVEMGWEVVNTSAGQQSEWVIPKNAAGHHINSVGLNQPGNLVISGHNNIEGKVFEAISMAWPPDSQAWARVDDFTDRAEILTGRKIRLYDAAGTAFEYAVTEFYRLKDSDVSLAQRIKNARFIAPTDDNRLTVLTCWPPTNNTYRLVVVAKPVGQP